MNLYEQELEDQTAEYCEKNQDDLDALVDSFEAQSESFDEASTYKGNAWSLDFTYGCVCVEQE